MLNDCPEYSTTGAGSLHDFASSTVGLVVCFAIGVAGFLALVLASKGRPAWRQCCALLLALIVGAGIGATSLGASTSAVCGTASMERLSHEDKIVRRGLPVHFLDGHRSGDASPAWALDGWMAVADLLFWAGCVALLIATRMAKHVPRPGDE